MDEPPRKPTKPRWTNRGDALISVSNSAGASTRQVRPVDLEWERQNGADSYQVLWDFGWGGVNFWPA